MKVTQEKLPASQLGLEIEITPEMSKQAYEKTVREFSRSINIPGFRKGKVPRQVLIQRIGSTRIKMAVIEDLIDTSVRQAIDQEDINAIGNFQLRSSYEELTDKFEPGKALKFSAAVDIPPDVEVQNYSGLSFQAEEVKYQPERIDDVLEDYRNRTATLVPVEDRSIQMGDMGLVDFSGTYIPSEGAEPLEIPGGNVQDFQLEMKEGQFIAGFVEGLVGMSAGESKELSLAFPEDYPQEDLAGKPALFSIALKEIKEKELPDLDDDFAQEVSDFETLQELRDTLEKRFKDEAEQKTKQNKDAAIFEELLKHVEVDLPESMIKREVDVLVTQTVMQLENQGLDIRKTLNQELVEGMRERARPDAMTRLKRTLALGEIAKKESIEFSDEELGARIKDFMESYNDADVDPERVRQVMSDELLEEKVLQWLEENGTVELVPEGTLSKSNDNEESIDNAENTTIVDVEATTVGKTENVPDTTEDQLASEPEHNASPQPEVAVLAENEQGEEEPSSTTKNTKTRKTTASKSTKAKKTTTQSKKPTSKKTSNDGEDDTSVEESKEK